MSDDVLNINSFYLGQSPAACLYYCKPYFSEEDTEANRSGNLTQLVLVNDRNKI